MNNVVGRIKKAERACKPCRDLKVRCLPCVERDDICQKCKRSGARCVFEEGKPRKKRGIPGDLENVTGRQAKVAGLRAQPESSLLETKNDANLQRSRTSGSWISFGGANGCTGSGTGLYEDPSGRVGCAYSTANTPNIHDVRNTQHMPAGERLFGNVVLAPDKVASYLSKYQKMCAYSPFVLTPEKVSIEELAANQPFTLHAILMVSSDENKDLQRMLEKSFRDQILRTVMIDGERSIDLLMALIVYLGWYHFFYIPIKQQFYQTLQIAISICVDLKLDRPPETATLSALERGQSLEDQLLLDATSDQFYSRSARRAYVGCYCLATITSWIWCKPSNFHCTDYLLRCARSLSDEPEYVTDTMIAPLLETHVLGNDQHRAYLPTKFDYSSPITPGQMEANLKKSQETLDKIQPKEQSECVSLNLARLYAASYGHEMNLLNPCNPPPSSDSEEKIFLTTSRRECLMFCLHSASKAFETFLSLPLEEYPKLSILQWWALICNTAYLYRLCLGIPRLPEWDTRVARDDAKLDIYLDLLCYRLERATGSTLEEPKGHDLYSLLCPIFINVKRSYERLKTLPKSLSSSDRQPVHANAFSGGPEKTVRKSATHQSRCPAFRYVSRAADVGLSPAGDDGDSNRLPGMSDIDMFLNSGLFECDTTWLAGTPQWNLSPFSLDNERLYPA
ncbi:uncharacterized protein Z519_09201 [Cladophialophora bantiana CBS 173.52]|uniref:Zn(2)-C6 fungal-type domain-containing protein n=1 Tax=Cladophialophora bantiana (strain ATCC 10958 / CBS 173.52 / CDC B-1940 / NIH 8579) TaxID=1442370 RepID=A0A0D2I133_CLAB1|nr:uncharacterized protein Z519_09201 [Cladophialophora bantiana CBS 173.52]KIW90554.1 hypothetical protein Z519_09201 [Cladophialophora bantiana CBS 173.52]